MWRSVFNGLDLLLLQPHCPLCGPTWTTSEQGAEPCCQCREKLDLPYHPLNGSTPLPWIAAGHYAGNLRKLILQLRHHCTPQRIKSLTTSLQTSLPAEAILIPIPSWKQTNRSNPLPGQLIKAINRPGASLLVRSRAVVGQHRLDRTQRWQNQETSFHYNDAAVTSRSIDWKQHQAWLVDDIITTGATVMAASRALKQAGICIAGAACLARTPGKHPL